MERALRRYRRAAGVLLLAAASVLGAAWAQEEPGGWGEAPPLPTPRSEMQAATLDGRVYVPGGLGMGRTLGVVEWFDPATGAWQEAAPLPEPVHHAGVTAAGGRLLVMGGYRDLSFRTDHAAVWAFDPAADAWERLPDLPAPRAAHALATVDDVVYVIGGVGPRAEETWRFDLRSETWLEPAAPLPTPREHLAAVVLDGRIHAVGGRVSGEGNVGAFEVLDPAADRWEALPDLPTPRSGLTAGAVGGRVHVTGGEELSGGRTFAAHEAFDPDTGAWTSAAPLDPPRHGLASAVLDGTWYVVGGATLAGGGTFVSLSEVVNAWRGGDD